MFTGLPELPGHRVFVQIQRVNGIPAITALMIEPAVMHGYAADIEMPPDAAITAERLRALPLRHLRESAAPIALSEPWTVTEIPSAVATVHEYTPPAGLQEALDIFDRGVLERRGRAWPDEHYERVATAYREAVERGAAPLNAIKDRWGVSRAAAAKWVKRARELGMLGYPAVPGKPGYSATKSPITGTVKRSRRSK